MAKLYQVKLMTGICDEGLGSYVLTGESKHLPNDGTWFGTLAEARKASAGKIEEIGRKILAQAERFRRV